MSQPTKTEGDAVKVATAYAQKVYPELDVSQESPRVQFHAHGREHGPGAVWLVAFVRFPTSKHVSASRIADLMVWIRPNGTVEDAWRYKR